MFWNVQKILVSIEGFEKTLAQTKSTKIPLKK